MSLFIHPTNQNILWNIITGNPLVINYFNSRPSLNKEQWFKTSISNFYSNNKNRHLDKDELNNMNKELLTLMVQSIRNQNIGDSGMNSIDPLTSENVINTPPFVKENREDNFNSQFQQRQQEYDAMVERKVPTEIDFRENNEDTSIQNMNELIEREQEERKKLLYSFPSENVVIPNAKLQIDKSNKNNLTVETIEVKEKKSVSWNNVDTTDNLSEIVAVHKSEMYSMRLHIIDITTQLDSMKMRMSELESKLDVSHIVTTTDKLKKEVEEIAENAEETSEEV
jgi:hypothetical protein